MHERDSKLGALRELAPDLQGIIRASSVLREAYPTDKMLTYVLFIYIDKSVTLNSEIIGTNIARYLLILLM